MYYECIFNESTQKTESYKEIDESTTTKSIIKDWKDDTEPWWKRYAILLAMDANAKGAGWGVYCEQTKSKVAIEFVSGSPALKVGETLELKAHVYPLTLDISWSSSDESIATVADGVVTAVAAGKATVTATDTNGNAATCEIVVSEAE